VQRKPIEFAIDVELAQLHCVARRSFQRGSACECRVEVELVETVHLRHVGHCHSAVRSKVVSQRARVVFLDEVNRVRRHIGCHPPLALIRRLRWCVDIHLEVADGAAGAKLDLGMPPAHAREAIHTVDDDVVSATSDALHRDRVVTEARDEAIPLFRLGGAAPEEC